MNQTAGGIGFVGMLTIVFIVLKLTSVVTWSWIWVLSPVWISWAIALFFGLSIILIALLANGR